MRAQIELKSVWNWHRRPVGLARLICSCKPRNDDLKQFAYSASHDLQEPLRTLAIYSQLLRRRYQGKLDEDAHRFLQFIDNAAHRMESLLCDLLAYTRITQAKIALKDVDSAKTLESVISELKETIHSTQATIDVGFLPM